MPKEWKDMTQVEKVTQEMASYGIISADKSWDSIIFCGKGTDWDMAKLIFADEKTRSTISDWTISTEGESFIILFKNA